MIDSTTGANVRIEEGKNKVYQKEYAMMPVVISTNTIEMSDCLYRQRPKSCGCRHAEHVSLVPI